MFESGLHGEYRYHDVLRRSGLYNNPNEFGLLAGVGFILSCGYVVSITTNIRHKLTVFNSALLFMCAGIMTLVLCGVALFKSYSRGAWLGAAIGFMYLFYKIQNAQYNIAKPRLLFFQKNYRLILAAVFFASILCFWQFRFTDWHPTRRVFSAANLNDFSWRNRVAAWNGAVHMMKDRPFFGFGWGEVEAAYSEKYRPPQIENGAAIQMNDYFVLGISAGVPTLVCFLMYVGLGLRRNPGLKSKVQSPKFLSVESGEANAFDELGRLQATCRAGAIVLIVGFFFDGGLFKLATGSFFWILLELGRVDIYRRGAEVQRAEIPIAVVNTSPRSFAGQEFSHLVGSGAQGTETPCHRSQWEIWLRRSAWSLGFAAVSESAILLATPFFGVNETTLAISRHYLIPPSGVEDLNLLATNVDWSSRKLRPLLQHASLANYNRQLINWKLDEETYRNYVLNPSIDLQRDGHLGWRRKLWEYFYLPIRKEDDPKSAAEIVLKFLRQRMSLVENGPVTIEAMWQQKKADAIGFEALKVAAFRSVGIPARLNGNGQAELFADGKWRTSA